MSYSLNPLTNRQQDICGYCGVFGALLALTCLIQHIIITRGHWITYMLAAFYLAIILCFLFLAFQQWFSPPLLIVASALSLVAEVILKLSGLFSLVVLLLFLYSVVVTVFIYIEQFPALLRQKANALKAEREEWQGKI